ncbi:mannose-1-phosphate guanylyltransferase/mannose-6-phosphate isomerase [Roseixanthobacter pseudopolyaromaticivorans]|uniref:mannose-1-phosphate guanylyltransferase/mannose-6-phosphate isomerase n=1 Tax=Xanthobacteraceae TaxID=335928 RepID=UPI003726F9C2
MSSAKIVPVILAGGTGTRLWPLSRNTLPKQFLTLTEGLTLYQDTISRVSDKSMFLSPIVVTNDDFRFFAQRQAAEIGVEATVILEPARRDSAPALIAAAAMAQKLHGEEVLVLALAADHVVLKPKAFLEAVSVAAQVAATGKIVTFGIVPDSPRTSYGYIRLGAPLAAGGNVVSAFVEKPDRETASRYVSEGFLWNSGNFLFPAGLMIAEAQRFEPELTDAALKAVATASEDLGFIRLGREAFEAAPAKSIDFAVLEHTTNAAVIGGDFGWSDIGSWDAVREIGTPDADGNVVQGSVALLDSHNSYVRSDGPLVTGIGLEGLSVIATEDAVLVMPSNRSQDVKALVASLKAAKINAADEHLKVHRPWGTYQTICRGERFHVKRIVVEPGAKLSLQKHHHRAEHWVVVRGTAEVTIDDRIFTVRENESTYIPLGGVHRLANPGRINLELIEVQTGSYLGEDDIVRIEDIYHRA